MSWFKIANQNGPLSEYGKMVTAIIEDQSKDKRRYFNENFTTGSVTAHLFAQKEGAAE